MTTAPGQSAVLAVQVTPRAKKNEIAGWQGDVLRVRLTAPPVDGAANAALIAFLADALGLRKSQLELVAGQTSRQKRIRINGLSAERLRKKLGDLEIG